MNTETKANSSCIILSGLFKYQKNKIDHAALAGRFLPWKTRINQGDFKSTYGYLQSTYYDNYLNNMFPDLGKQIPEIDFTDSPCLLHLTLKQLVEIPESFKDLRLSLSETVDIEFAIDYADLYLFPENIGIFSIKTVAKKDDLDSVSDFLNRIRYLESKALAPGNDEPCSVKRLIEELVLAPLHLPSDWDIYNPQLKTYALIDLKEQISTEELNGLLFDFGNVSKPGTANSNELFAPSERFFREQIEANTISVFKNWGAIALFDTFTRISMDFPDQYKSWENDYFQIYIHCLYLKFYLYLTNSQLSDVTVVTKKSQRLRDQFIEFLNDHDLSHISYKFLPNLIHDKFILALDIHSEIDKMETKIHRLNDHLQEKAQRNLNLVLIVITVLSVFSVISELSEWFVNLGISRELMYPFTSIGLGIAILLLLLVVFKMSKK